MLEMRKYTMAAANPILAEKLSTPTEQNLQSLTTASRLQVAPLIPKLERGREFKSIIIILAKIINVIEFKATLS